MRLTIAAIGNRLIYAVVLVGSLFFLSNSSLAQEKSLASAAQNPIGSLITVPFEYNGNYGVGTLDNNQSVFLVKPVFPIPLNDEWTLVVRGIFPYVYKPELFPGDSREHGLGDITLQTFFVPKEPTPVPGGIFTWGVGPTFQFNTATDPSLGTGKTAIGFDAVAFWAIQPWTFGALVSNVWSVSGDAWRDDVNALTFQPFVNYNMDDGWYLTSSPAITANWEADHSERWTIPLGGGFGRIFSIGSQPVNAQVQAFGYADTPTGGPDWSIRASFTFLFPQ